MDLMGLIVVLRWPLEIVAFGLALVPVLSLLLAWGSLPSQIPAHFGPTGHPDRWSSRSQLWILPVLALVVYGFMSEASGTWAWVLDGRMDLSAGAEIPLLFKPVVGLLIAYSSEMLIRIARKQGEVPNGWFMCGFMMLLLASPLALSVVAH